MIVHLHGEVLDTGMSAFQRDGHDVEMSWLVLYQREGSERPGITTQVWTQEPLSVAVGKQYWIRAWARADGGRIKLSGAEVVAVGGEEVSR